MVFKRLAPEYGVFTKFLRLYIHTELIAGSLSDHFMRTYCYHLPFVVLIVKPYIAVEKIL
jgi:hypothetical protein